MLVMVKKLILHWFRRIPLVCSFVFSKCYIYQDLLHILCQMYGIMLLYIRIYSFILWIDPL